MLICAYFSYLLETHYVVQIFCKINTYLHTLMHTTFTNLNWSITGTNDSNKGLHIYSLNVGKLFRFEQENHKPD